MKQNQGSAAKALAICAIVWDVSERIDLIPFVPTRCELAKPLEYTEWGQNTHSLGMENV